MEVKKKVKVNRINRKVTAIAALMIFVLVLLEVYAHTYVQVHRLPVLTEEEALKLIPYYYNSTCTFSSDGARWLVALQNKKPTPSLNFAYLYIFKMEQNRSFLVQDIDLLILGLNSTSNSTGGYFLARIEELDYQSNFTVVRIWYDIGQIGTYQVDFGLRVKVYEETLLGSIPKEEMKVPVTATIYYGP